MKTISEVIILTINYIVIILTSGGSDVGEGFAPPPSNFNFHFHAVFGEIMPNNRLTSPLGNPGSVTANA